MSLTMDVEEECKQLVKELERIASGNKNGNDRLFCTYGQLFDDDLVQNTFEALMGTLKAAKKRGLIHYEGQLLLQGVHNHVEIEIM